MTTDTAAELEIPDASRLAMHKAQREPYELNDRDAALYARDVAAPVVAAELRRIADLDPSWTICGPATFLRARADELDPPAKEGRDR